MRRFFLLVGFLLVFSVPLRGQALACPDTGALCAASWALSNPSTVFSGFWQPSGSVVFTGGVAQVTVSWNVPAVTLAGYNVYSAPSAYGPWTRINLSLFTGTIFSDPTAVPGQVYYYHVVAVSASGSPVASSNEAVMTVPTS